MSTTQDDTIKAAMSVARDVAEGRLDPAALDAAVADECRALFGVVAGPADPLWSLHVDVARQVLALGGVPANELSEWAAVIGPREQQSGAVVAAETSAAPSVDDSMADAESSASGPHSPDSIVAETED
ncbi:flagellar hook-length control protein [Mycolicibacterium holsaticum]|uniref:flagellar hook-length control protein n=1 Tax=Mycolicibacterium holsaticum TaxID=152142 RepID=UPI001C7CA344|nr:flagellar hook-length control protein [Mycolicibacterium holsaticum]MDA4108159.1 flagellar hook-length control protein [Mycolicibacterium holsaticum DSM 44478 = JCM 12374]QZA14431.1 flagellar hook-length control protein [Mycolicibacterium holsaticum DSM 44478 = JCM 12374]UNC08119.1 flagellar hook-length control protein [Mycolicibacterium holsaticum DSM 44478 = JCM 12374]